MNLFRTKLILICLLTGCLCYVHGQDSGFDSFIARISKQYQIDLAVAPELLPSLDSIRNLGLEQTNIEELLHQLLDGKNISYQIVDGNKLMLRRESTAVETPGLYELSGRILDNITGQPLPFAAVSIKGSSRGAFTDENGHFSIKTNDTTATLQINYLGYKTKSIPAKNLSGTSNAVRLEMISIPLRQVIIVIPFQQMTFNNELQSINLKGYQFFSADQLLNGNSEDLLNSLNNYTQFSSDQGIRLRGSDSENSLVLMDGLPVYDPYHFYNIFSAFNGHYFSSVRLYKNNMPVEYGGRIDGLISIDSDHDAPGSGILFDTDLLLTSMSADWDISNKVRLTAGARVSHTGILNEALIDSTVANFTDPGKFKDENEWSSSQQPTFNFYDINGGLRATIGKQSDLKVAYFKNRDKLDTKIVTDFETKEHNDVVSVKQTINNNDTWQNEGVSFDLNTPLINQTKLNFNGFISSFEKSSAYKSTTDEFQHNKHHYSSNSGLQNSQLQTAGIKVFLSETISGGHAYKIGVDFERHTIDLLALENNKSYLSEDQKEFESTLFGEYRLSPLRNLELTLGGRITHLKSTSDLYLQPHVLLNYFAGDHFSFKTSFSKNIQSIQQVSLENRFGREIEFLALSQPETGYPVLKSDKYMVGGGYTSSHFNMDLEFYYKKLNGLANVRASRPDPSFHDHSEPDEFYRLYTGDGWTAGMDVLMAYKRNNFEAMISYTLSKISERYDKLFRGDSFSPEEDRRNQFKLSGHYKVGKFIPGALLTYKSKAPYLSLVRIDGRGGIENGDPNDSFRYLPSYFSVDLGLDYSFNVFKLPAQIGASVINATNHHNINDIEHIGMVDRDEGGPGGNHGLYLTQETELPGRTFNVHARILIK